MQKALPKDADSDAEEGAKKAHLEKVLNCNIYKEDVRIIISDQPLTSSPLKHSSSPKKFGGGGGFGRKIVKNTISSAKKFDPIGTEQLLELLEVEPETKLLFEQEDDLLN